MNQLLAMVFSLFGKITTSPFNENSLHNSSLRLHSLENLMSSAIYEDILCFANSMMGNLAISTSTVGIMEHCTAIGK